MQTMKNKLWFVLIFAVGIPADWGQEIDDIRYGEGGAEVRILIQRYRLDGVAEDINEHEDEERNYY